MWTAGTSGERMCATTETPLAQKRPSSAAPATFSRNVSESVPCTVETLTPTFSNTRPRMMDMTPPPPPGRSQPLRSKRPGGAS